MRLRFAIGFLDRLKGLLGEHPNQDDGQILAFVPCKSVHTFGMHSNLDVAFVGDEGRVLEVHRNVPPRKVLSCRRARVTLERFAAPDEPWFEADDSLVLCRNENNERKVSR